LYKIIKDERYRFKIIFGIRFQNATIWYWLLQNKETRANTTSSVKMRRVTPLQLHVSREEGQTVQPCAIAVFDKLQTLFTIL